MWDLVHGKVCQWVACGFWVSVRGQMLKSVARVFKGAWDQVLVWIAGGWLMSDSGVRAFICGFWGQSLCFGLVGVMVSCGWWFDGEGCMFVGW